MLLVNCSHVSWYMAPVPNSTGGITRRLVYLVLVIVGTVYTLCILGTVCIVGTVRNVGTVSTVRTVSWYYGYCGYRG